MQADHMQEQLYDLLMKDDEITWQTIILDLINTEQMDPWDIDVGKLCKRYLETLKELKEQNFFLSGKVILAAALLLRIKSIKLVEEDIANFDQLLFPQELENMDDFITPEHHRVKDIPKLAIKTPQARKRKVSLKELLGALQKVLDTNRKKIRQHLEEVQYKHPELPHKRVDISALINTLYDRILDYLKREEKVHFSTLVNSDKREDKVYTFVPLLHLSNQGKVSLQQKQAFSEISIYKYKEEVLEY